LQALSAAGDRLFFICLAQLDQSANALQLMAKARVQIADRVFRQLSGKRLPALLRSPIRQPKRR